MQSNKKCLLANQFTIIKKTQKLQSKKDSAVTDFFLLHLGLSSLAADPMTAGVPSFVVQEEFDRYTGYWWEPDTKKSNHYRILYEEVDESEVEILSIFSPSDVKGVDEYRYPRAGLYDF